MLQSIALTAQQAARGLAINGVLAASCGLSMLGLGGAAAGQGAVFMLHHIRPVRSLSFRPNAGLEILPETLDRTLDMLKAEGRDFIALADLPKRLAAGRDAPPFAVFTIDDGYRDNRDHALPVFERHGAPFTIFINKGFAQRTHSMWWETAEQLLNRVDRIEIDLGNGPETIATDSAPTRSLAFRRLNAAICSPREAEKIARLDAVAREAGIDPIGLTASLTMDDHELAALSRHPLVDLGAHSVSHRGLAFLDQATMEDEIAQSLAHVEAVTGRKPATFAYPYGDGRSVNDAVARVVRHAGMIAVTTKPGVVRHGNTEFQLIPRVSLNGLFQQPWQVRALASGLPFALTGR